jgi:hypothetical protein
VGGFEGTAEQRTGGRQHVVDEDEDGLLGGELDALTDDVHKLTHLQSAKESLTG